MVSTGNVTQLHVSTWLAASASHAQILRDRDGHTLPSCDVQQKISRSEMNGRERRGTVLKDEVRLYRTVPAPAYVRKYQEAMDGVLRSKDVTM
jgi:hypothetical protein